MCFKKKKAPPAPVIPAAPKVPEFESFINRITGTEVRKVRRTDGSQSTEVVRIRTPQEEAFFTGVQNEFRNAVDGIKDAYAMAPEALPDFAPFMNALGRVNQERIKDLAKVAGLPQVEEDVKRFRDISNQYLNERAGQESEALENMLAQRGLSQSSEGDKMRRDLKTVIQKAGVENDWKALQYGEDLASSLFTRRAKGFELRDIGRQAEIDQAGQQYGLERQNYTDNMALRSQNIQEATALADVYNKIESQDFDRGLRGNVEDKALAYRNADSALSLNHHNANADTIKQNYAFKLKEHEMNNQPGFLESVLMNTVGSIGGAMGGGYLTKALGIGSGATSAAAGGKESGESISSPISSLFNSRFKKIIG